MNVTSRTSFVGHKTTRPGFFYPTDPSKSKGSSVKTSSSYADLKTAAVGNDRSAKDSSFNLLTVFGTKLDSVICPPRSAHKDRALKAEGSHALKLCNGTGDGQNILCRNGKTERGSGTTRNCPKTNVPSLKLNSCSETSKAKAVISENSANASVPAVQPAELVELAADPGAVVIVDCRNFMVFNSNHIKGALSVNLANKITRKRFVDGHLTISDLVSGPESKVEYKNKEETAVIVIYDDNTVDLASLPAAHPLKLLTSRLKSEGRDARYLVGMNRTFLCSCSVNGTPGHSWTFFRPVGLVNLHCTDGGIQTFQTSFSEYCEHPDAQPNPPFLYSPTSQDVDAAVDTATASEILPFLYVGNERDASCDEILKELGITHILNVTAQIPFRFEGRLICKRLPASDSGNQNLKQYFEEAVKFIETARITNGRVLVHCQAGVSRSPTIAMAYVMARFEKSLQDAFAFVHNRRSIISPNLNFMGQLLEFGQRNDLSSLFDTPQPCEYRPT